MWDETFVTGDANRCDINGQIENGCVKWRARKVRSAIEATNGITRNKICTKLRALNHHSGFHLIISFLRGKRRETDTHGAPSASATQTQFTCNNEMDDIVRCDLSQAPPRLSLMERRWSKSKCGKVKLHEMGKRESKFIRSLCSRRTGILTDRSSANLNNTHDNYTHTHTRTQERFSNVIARLWKHFTFGHQLFGRTIIYALMFDDDVVHAQCVHTHRPKHLNTRMCDKSKT